MINLWTRPEIATPTFYHSAFLRELSKVFRVDPIMRGTGDEDSCHVLMVLARWLFEHQNWFRSLKGPRIIIEHDAYLNFMPSSQYYKCWTRLYRNCNFDLIISSGKVTTERLREEGLPAVWVPKGCNTEFCDVKNQFSGQVGYFGYPIAEQETGKKFDFYESRGKMSEFIDNRLPLIGCEFKDFSDTVSQYSAAVTNDETMCEPMAKQFECSAMGCLMIRDKQPELYDLGFVEGESILSYENFDELAELCDMYTKEEARGDLKRMQKKARYVARNHTWEHRAKEVYTLVKPYMKDRIFV
jgi:hypothetical protein